MLNYSDKSAINICTLNGQNTANGFNPIFCKKMLCLSKASHIFSRTIWNHLGEKELKKVILLYYIRFDKGTMCFNYLIKRKLGKAGHLLQLVCVCGWGALKLTSCS